MVRTCLILFALVLLCVPSSAWGQRKKGDISVNVGWQWGGGITTPDGRFEVAPSINYGLEVNVLARREGEIVLLYNRQDSEVIQRGGGAVPDDTLFGVAVNYFQIGGAGIAPVDGPLKPYVALTLGLTWFDPKQSGVSSSWRFSGSLGGGIKISPTERIGFRAQGRWWFNIITAGSTWWCGLPGGCAVSVSGTVISQGEVSGGLMVNF